jgi:hypothetical protein
MARLTEQLAAAAGARDDRLRDADLAARALVLPSPRSRPLADVPSMGSDLNDPPAPARSAPSGQLDY